MGRTPSDLQPEGFGSAIDFDAEVAAGLDTETCLDEQVVLEELQLSSFDSSDDNDSGHSQSDFGDVSDRDDPENVDANSFTGGDEGGRGGRIASTSKEPAIRIIYQSLLERNKRKKKNCGDQVLLYTLYDAVISSISNKLHKAILLTPLNYPPVLVSVTQPNIAQPPHNKVRRKKKKSPTLPMGGTSSLDLTTRRFESGVLRLILPFSNNLRVGGTA